MSATPEIVVTEVTPIVASSNATPVTPPSHDDVKALLAAVVERLERLEKAAEVKAVSCSCLPFWSKKAEASAGAGSA